jgi:hypothetical protein
MAYKFIIKGIRKFNEEKVVEKALVSYRGIANDPEVKVMYHETSGEEKESYTVMTVNVSSQGVNIKHMNGGNIIVELPWLASQMDVRLCYAYLNAVKKVHRGARIMDEEDKGVKLTEADAKEQWQQRWQNMDEIINKGEKLVVAGAVRDFHLNPAKYVGRDEATNRIGVVFEDLVTIQWANLDAINVREEKRHVTEEEELSSIRVVDNQEDAFIGACQYVGMMKGNTCKMVKFEDFCHLMKEQDEFQLLDDAQALLNKMDDEQWNELFDRAGGIVRENFRKTFIMRWNTDISNYTLSEFEDAMEDFFDEGFYYDWSIWDYQKAHIGDKFYMIRTGEGANGVVMRGTIIGTPYPDEDWSGKGRKVYYIRMNLTNMIHPERTPLLLTTDELTKAVPDFNWKEGHSGEILNDTQSAKLEEAWEDYIGRTHAISSEEVVDGNFNDFYKEKGWKRPECYQGHGDHIDTIMDPEEFLEKHLPEVGTWTFFDTAHTHITHNEYQDDEGDLLVVKTGGDMGMIALMLNNAKAKRIDFVSTYPFHKGIPHKLTIKKVAEWDNQVEAVVYAETEEMPIAFYATDYYTNKKKYVPGAELDIELAASAYKIVEGESETVLDAETSAKMRSDMGIEPEYDKEGNILPMILCNEELVAYLPHNEEYPDDAEFASSIKSVEQVSLFGIDFIKAEISICHEPEETYVPLYFKKEYLPDAKKGTLVRGFLWMQGKINDEN